LFVIRLLKRGNISVHGEIPAIAPPFKAGIMGKSSVGFSPINLISKKINMPFIKVWIHYVWATKNRQPILYDECRYQLFDHIRENAQKKEIFLNKINGHYDHVHCLISLSSDQTIEKIAQLLKGESSFWYNNKTNFKTQKLEWQDEYFAVSVGASQLDTVRAYIDNQEIHHRKKTFAEEYDEFISKYGFGILAKAK
jgi:REP element-mobilizing transposase RayT